jgi:hypothetical protein
MTILQMVLILFIFHWALRVPREAVSTANARAAGGDRVGD